MRLKNKVKLFAAILMFVSYSVSYANVIQKEINTGWKYRQARLTNWYPATVPGVIHTDLYASKIIEDPFFRLNERGQQWIDKEDWIYETDFDVPEEIMGKSNIFLHFYGLDTYADVYLNGELILNANNMFREWKINVKDKLKPEINQLQIYFHSPIKIDMPKFDSLPFHYRTGPDQSENGGIFDKRVSIFARKAGYHYGWDWGSRFVTSGIWRPVFLEAWNDLRIENVFIHQKSVNTKKAVITTNVEVLSDKEIKGAKISVKDNAGGKVYGTVNTDLKKGSNLIPVNFTIPNPRLWWCNGLGKAEMYTFNTEITVNSVVADNNRTSTGLRSIKVINRPDRYGTEFYLELNGVPVFAKGANYIPSDNFLPRVTAEKYEQTILDAANANMNMLRVWGGGIYENDIFYDLCDKYGIMVWQDFMFACSLYPSEGEFLENIRQEAIDNVKRLRNHPSIALWCGNNEVNEFWISWGWKEFYAEQGYEDVVWKQYTDLFHKTLPEVVLAYDPDKFYWPSSPYNTGSNDDVNNDRHYWGVWHGKEPTYKFNEIRSRFFSEYGFQSFPEFESVKVFAPDPEDWNITSEVMMAHQRAGNYANPRIHEYLIDEYKEPKDFKGFLYMSQVLQGDAVKIAVEAHRRDMPYCMGTLFWQHNDCWPVASWSSRDYYGRWKAQHYYAKKAYRDILVSPIAKGDTLDVFIVSDRLKSVRGVLDIKIVKFDGTEVYHMKKTIGVPANTSTNLFSADIKSLLKDVPANEVFVLAGFTDHAGALYTNRYFLTKQKEIDFPQADIKKSIQAVDKGYEVSLTADKFVRAVFLSIDGIDNFFEDNYFDILPGQEVKIKVRTGLSKHEFEKQLEITSFTDYI
jgi:beta-mannosidase